MRNQKPTVVLVHGALAEATSWSGVVERLRAHSPPPTGFAGDAACVPDVIAGIGKPVVLTGHS